MLLLFPSLLPLASSLISPPILFGMPDPRPPVPAARLDRASLERVLARAAQLQGATGDASEADQFTEEQLIELGKEVGLSPQHLRQALAEERTGSIARTGDSRAGLFGPVGASAA